MRKEERVLLLSSNLWEFGSGLLGPLYAVFATSIGGDILDITGAWAAFLILSGVVTIYVGKLADRFGHNRLMLTGYLLNALFTFGYLLIDTTAELFIVQIGLGIALALANPTWSALFDEFSTDAKDGYLWGLSYGQADISAGIAILLGGVIVTYSSFTTLFIVMGAFQILAAIIQFRMPTRKLL